MSNEIIKVGNVEVKAKEYRGQRVVTVWDIAEVHNKRVSKINELFKYNRSKFTTDIDYFSMTPKEFSESFSGFQSKIPNNVKEIILFTESGYLKLTKPFTDDLSWKVQGMLIDVYFKAKEMEKQSMRILPSNYEEALEELLIEVKKTKALENKIEEDRPKVEFYDTVVKLEKVFDMKKSAKLLDFIGIGRNRLYELLRKQKVLMKDNEPYQSYIERKWFKIKEELVEEKLVLVVYVTQLGLNGIRKLLIKLGYEPRY